MLLDLKTIQIGVVLRDVGRLSDYFSDFLTNDKLQHFSVLIQCFVRYCIVQYCMSTINRFARRCTFNIQLDIISQ